jgi:enolase
MIEGAVRSIELAGYTPGRDFMLAIDVASSEFCEEGAYWLDQSKLDSQGMVSRLAHWVEQYPIVSVEDGLSEEDWENWPKLRSAIGHKALVLGDDLLCTKPSRIGRAVEESAVNALLLKVNQVGTLSEAAESFAMARAAGWNVTVSARSGETEDNWAADLVVGWSGDQFKVGSITQSERLAKYNRLLQIEAETGLALNNWPNDVVQ